MVILTRFVLSLQSKSNPKPFGYISEKESVCKCTNNI